MLWKIGEVCNIGVQYFYQEAFEVCDKSAVFWANLPKKVNRYPCIRYLYFQPSQPGKSRQNSPTNIQSGTMIDNQPHK